MCIRDRLYIIYLQTKIHKIKKYWINHYDFTDDKQEGGWGLLRKYAFYYVLTSVKNSASSKLFPTSATFLHSLTGLFVDTVSKCQRRWLDGSNGVN